MFGFGSNKTEETPKPKKDRYARTSLKLDPEDEVGSPFSLDKAVGSTWGTTDIDYVLAHYATRTMQQIDRIDSCTYAIYNTINEALEERGWEGKYHELEEQYMLLVKRHDAFIKYLADDKIKQDFNIPDAYRDPAKIQR